MERMNELYSREALARLRKRNRVWRVVLAALGGATLVACALLCAFLRPRNAGAMLGRILLISTLGGWAVIALWLNVLLPGRREAAHEAHMLDGPAEYDEGVVTVTREWLRIPKSAPMLRAELRDGTRVRRLTVSPRKAKQLGETPRRMRVRLVFGCIAAWEACDAGD